MKKILNNLKTKFKDNTDLTSLFADIDLTPFFVENPEKNLEQHPHGNIMDNRMTKTLGFTPNKNLGKVSIQNVLKSRDDIVNDTVSRNGDLTQAIDITKNKHPTNLSNMTSSIKKKSKEKLPNIYILQYICLICIAKNDVQYIKNSIPVVTDTKEINESDQVSLETRSSVTNFFNSLRDLSTRISEPPENTNTEQPVYVSGFFKNIPM